MSEPLAGAPPRLVSSTLVAALLLCLGGCSSGPSQPQASLSTRGLALLGTAEGFAVLGGEAVTNTGPSLLNGNVGVSPGTSITGFPPGVITSGAAHSADAVASQAQLDSTAAYLALKALPCDHVLTGTDLGGLTLKAGVNCFAKSAQLTGTLSLDAEGKADAVFVFQIGSTLTAASGSHVLLLNGASECNVFWQVGSSATIGTGSSFVGNILALTSIALQTGATLSGRALAQTGAVTLDTNRVIPGSCASGLDGGTAGADAGAATPDGGTRTPDGGVTCQGTVCGCGCVDLTSDRGNCGRCDAACGAGEICTAGQCVAACHGTTLCGGACVSLRTDSSNCGRCGVVCAADAPCNGGACGACPGAWCNGWCVDLGWDRNACGACGNACATNEKCAAGVCVACAGTMCGNACIDLDSDPKNCGVCGNDCGLNGSCSAGKCAQRCP